MSNYKTHILFSILMIFPFFPDVYYLSLAVVGASVVDLDTSFRYRNLVIMALVGGIMALTLPLFKITPFPGILLLSIALFFFVAQHRGFVHSIPGTAVSAACLALFVFSFQQILSNLTPDPRVSFLLTSLLLGIIVLNRGLLIIYSLLVIVGIFLTHPTNFNFIYVVTALFVGSISHLILDLFSGNGVKLFAPLYKRRFGKITGLFILFLWLVALVSLHLYPGENYLSLNYILHYLNTSLKQISIIGLPFT
ncbi:putative membrane protein [Methanobacterium sp. MB1]|jgi:inner membrane protein|uniref:metal-dependent hydrolase n=1 Tax=Methanobacterium sp. TaxID=2164 RepID=UPI0003C9915B|nr:metal-dependent hydrolase [Methanobacterium sp.]CDG65896.1 putative membrane protein [Methanobacterium sp. MB1]